MLVDGSPEPMLPARDIDHDLVEMPFVPGCRKTPATWLAKPSTTSAPTAARLMTYLDAAGGQRLLNHAQA